MFRVDCLWRLARAVAPMLLLAAGASLARGGSLLFVADGGSWSLQTYDAATGTLVNQDAAGGAIGFPARLAVGPDGNVYLSDLFNGVVDRFSGTTGAFLGTFVGAGKGLIAPSGLAFGLGGDLYVADYGNGGESFINVYNGLTGDFLEQLVAPGAGAPNGGLDDPNGIAFGSDGLYIADPINGIDVFNPVTGAFVSVLVPVGSGPGAPAGLADPSGVAFGPNGDLFVADETNSVVDRFDATTGAFLGVFGDPTLLVQPTDLSFGPDGNLYVTDANGVERFDGRTGASLGAFVPVGGGSRTRSRSHSVPFRSRGRWRCCCLREWWRLRAGDGGQPLCKGTTATLAAWE